jgi:P-type Cu+ transporter
MSSSTASHIQCYHCGEDCVTTSIKMQDKHFCCEGCKMVYGILRQNGLCNYYELNSNPGASLKQPVRENKFNFLEDAAIQQKLILFQDSNQTHVSFYLPQMHCSSCLYLLENLHRINENLVSSTVNFPRKELSLIFNHRQLSLRKVAELLTSIGYEPHISLHDLGHKKPGVSKKIIYQLGIAGFCFANIMLLSFPEYLGLDGSEKKLQGVFRLLTIVLSLPVLLYSAQPFFESAWKGWRHRFLNIDAPVALAILITFGRSIFEILVGSGAGYFDSMTGIVFFMLVGRVLQNKTYQQLSFDRDYTAYFPIAITVIKEGKEIPVALPEIRVNDTLLIHNEELIPADGILTRGKAWIDYSFVTGESTPVAKEMGEIVYAGGKQTAGNIEILTIKEVAQSYLTQLWNNQPSTKNNGADALFVHTLSRYFTWVVLSLAIGGALYWSFYDLQKSWNVITTVLIVACPCALLLSSTFTNGNILRILSRNKLYLRNAQTIDTIARVNQVVFDKTGTLTNQSQQDIRFEGSVLSGKQKTAVAALAAQSTHPLSKAIAGHLAVDRNGGVTQFREIAGRGVEGWVNDQWVVLGSSPAGEQVPGKPAGTQVHLEMDNCYLGYFHFSHHYREGLQPAVQALKKQMPISVISGDTNAERTSLQQWMGSETEILFQQQPHQKMNYIKQLQQQGKTVLMMGDGLNDAGALRQADVGMAVVEDTSQFTPASDAILEASQMYLLPRMIRLCRVNKQIIIASFVLSIVYNGVGLFFALQGMLSPLIAAVLMPASSISILILTYGSSTWAARWLKL